jgi:hypothetical protein
MPETTVKEYLHSIAALWTAQIDKCKNARRRDFDDDADAVMKYAGDAGLPRTIYVSDDITKVAWDRQFTVLNYTQLFIDDMTPYVCASVPNRLVQPSRSQVPPELENEYPDISVMQGAMRKRDTMLSYLMQSALSWFPKVYNAKEESEKCVREAAGRGRGVRWVEIIDGPSGEVPACYHDSAKNLYIDPDCRTLREASYIIRYREAPVWKIAELWGESVEDISGTATSSLALSAAEANNRPLDSSVSDRAGYYEIWSVMGIGHKLATAPDEMTRAGALKDAFDACGPYVHFAIIPGIDHPLGIKPETLEAEIDPAAPARFRESLQAMLAWPIKTYGNVANPWPMRCLDFRPRSDCPWPTPPLKPAIILQEFIDLIMRGLMARGVRAGKITVVTSTALDEETKAAIQSFDIVSFVQAMESNVGEAVEKFIAFVQDPPVDEGVFRLLELADRAFREITGLDPSLHGSNPKTQERSAAATSMRQAGLSRRPDEYADKVEQHESEIAALEAIAARQLVSAFTIAPLFGEQILHVEPTEAMPPEGQPQLEGQPPTDEFSAAVAPQYSVRPAEPDDLPESLSYAAAPLTQHWVELAMTDDPWLAASECEYTVEAGSGRRRNKQLQQENAQQLYNMLGQQAFTLSLQLGNLEPYLALVRMVGDAYEMPTEPVIQKIREAIAQKAAAPPAVPPAEGQPPEAAGEQPAQPLDPGALPMYWLGAAGGPRKPVTSPPPGTM